MKTINKGFSLVELMVVVAIGGITSLVMASIFVFSAQEFHSLIEQNQAEESLLLSSYYLRATLTQAVKLRSVAGDPVTLFNAATVAPPTAPLNIAVGFLDNRRTCNDANCTIMPPAGTAWPAGVPSALAIFIRENGGFNIDTSTATPWTASQFLPTAIFYRPPNTGVFPQISGRLYVTQAGVGGSITDTDAALQSGLIFDGIVAFGLSTSNLASCPATTGSAEYNGAIPCVNLYIRVRYFKGAATSKCYDPDPVVASAVAGCIYRDVDMRVNINLRNNIINASATGDPLQKDRVNSGLYFFRFTAPSLSDF